MLSPSPGDSDATVTDPHYRADSYSLERITTPQERQTYLEFLKTTYKALDILDERVYPRPDAELFCLRCLGEFAGTCALSPVIDESSFYFSLIPPIARARRRPRLLELNNVIISPKYRGTIALPLLLHRAAQRSWERGSDYLVGITRYQTLTHFVDFGVIPVEHPPLHYLGKQELKDFVVYYDTHSGESLWYLHYRARVYFHQLAVMHEIRRKHFQSQQEFSSGASQRASADVSRAHGNDHGADAEAQESLP